MIKKKVVCYECIKYIKNVMLATWFGLEITCFFDYKCSGREDSNCWSTESRIPSRFWLKHCAVQMFQDLFFSFLIECFFMRYTFSIGDKSHRCLHTFAQTPHSRKAAECGLALTCLNNQSCPWERKKSSGWMPMLFQGCMHCWCLRRCVSSVGHEH